MNEPQRRAGSTSSTSEPVRIKLLNETIVWERTQPSNFVEQLGELVGPRIRTILRRYKREETIHKHWSDLLHGVCERVEAALSVADRKALLEHLRKHQPEKGIGEWQRRIDEKLALDETRHTALSQTAMQMAIDAGDAQALQELLQQLSQAKEKEVQLIDLRERDDGVELTFGTPEQPDRDQVELRERLGQAVWTTAKSRVVT